MLDPGPGPWKWILGLETGSLSLDLHAAAAFSRTRIDQQGASFDFCSRVQLSPLLRLGDGQVGVSCCISDAPSCPSCSRHACFMYDVTSSLRCLSRL